MNANFFATLLIFLRVDVAICQCSNNLWTQIGARCYLWQAISRNQSDAVARCAELDSRLPVIKSSVDMANFESLIATNLTKYNTAQWFGMVTANAMTLLSIDDGTLLVYSNWDNLQPSGDGKCVGRDGSSKWNDFACGMNLNFFCEQSASGQNEVQCAKLNQFYAANKSNCLFATTYLITDNIPGNVIDNNQASGFFNLYAATIHTPVATQPLYQVTYGSNQIQATAADLATLGVTPNRVLAYFPLNTTSANLTTMYLYWYGSASNPTGSMLIPRTIIMSGWILKSNLYAFVGLPGAPSDSATCSFLSGSTILTSISTTTSTRAASTSTIFAKASSTTAASISSATVSQNVSPTASTVTATAAGSSSTKAMSLSTISTSAAPTIFSSMTSAITSATSSAFVSAFASLTTATISTTITANVIATDLSKSQLTTLVTPTLSISESESSILSATQPTVTDYVTTASSSASTVTTGTFFAPTTARTAFASTTASTIANFVSTTSSSLSSTAATNSNFISSASFSPISETSSLSTTSSSFARISTASTTFAKSATSDVSIVSTIGANPSTDLTKTTSTSTVAPIASITPLLTSKVTTPTRQPTTDAGKLITQTSFSTTTDLTYEAAAVFLTSIGIDPASLSDSVTITTAITASIPFLLANMTDAEKSALFVSLDATVNNCEYDGRPCDMTNEWKTEINPQYGNCFTFNGNDPPVNASSTGYNRGLHMILKGSKDEYTCNSASAGFILQIHDPHEPSLPDTYGQYIAPGFVTNFAFAKTAISKLPPPYGTCIERPNDVPQYYYDGTYITEMCLRSCFQKLVLDKCGCGDPRYAIADGANICGIDKKICVDNIGQCENALVNTSKCGCADGCKANIYLSAISASSLESDFSILDSNDTCSDQCNEKSWSRQLNAVIHVYFAHAYAVSYTEQPARDVFTLLYDASSFPQMFTGFCVMSLFEIFGLLVRIIMYKTSSYE